MIITKEDIKAEFEELCYSEPEVNCYGLSLDEAREELLNDLFKYGDMVEEVFSEIKARQEESDREQDEYMYKEHIKQLNENVSSN